MTTLSELRTMFQDGHYVLYDRGELSDTAAIQDLQSLMDRAQPPTWLAAIYSSLKGLVLVMEGSNRPYVLHYSGPLYATAAHMVVNVAGIRISDHTASKLKLLFGRYAQIALTDLSDTPQVNISSDIPLSALP